MKAFLQRVKKTVEEWKAEEHRLREQHAVYGGKPMAQTLTLEVPDAIYERVERAAQAMKQPVEYTLIRIIELGLPPLDAPTEFETDLRAMEALADEALWDILKSKVSPATQRKLHRLLDKNQAATLTAAEHQKLEALQSEADWVMLRKAHAAVLLKWRGHRIPTREELRKLNPCQ